MDNNNVDVFVDEKGHVDSVDDNNIKGGEDTYYNNNIDETLMTSIFHTDNSEANVFNTLTILTPGIGVIPFQVTPCLQILLMVIISF